MILNSDDPVTTSQRVLKSLPHYHNIDNIICLTGQPGGRAAIPFRVLWKGVVLVSTYEELMVILTVGLLIVAILNLKNK